MRTNPIHGAGPGLPVATLEEIHDCIALALDGMSIDQRYWNAAEISGYLRAGLRKTKALLPEGVA